MYEIVVLSLPNSKLLGKILKGIERVAGIKFFVLFPVAALNLAVMFWSKRSDLKTQNPFSCRKHSILPIHVENDIIR